MVRAVDQGRAHQGRAHQSSLQGRADQGRAQPGGLPSAYQRPRGAPTIGPIPAVAAPPGQRPFAYPAAVSLSHSEPALLVWM